MLKIRQEQMAALEAHMADRFRQKLLKQLWCELMDESLKQKLDPPGTVPADSSPHGTDPLGEAPPGRVHPKVVGGTLQIGRAHV